MVGTFKYPLTHDSLHKLWSIGVQKVIRKNKLGVDLRLRDDADTDGPNYEIGTRDQGCLDSSEW